MSPDYTSSVRPPVPLPADQLRELFAQAAEPFLLIEDGRFIGSNACAQAMLGHSAAEFRQLSFAEVSSEFQANGARSSAEAQRLCVAAAAEPQHFRWV